jgi:nucleotide-binding universal stress UspA family protein
MFLVVVDDSPERVVALRYACLRALKSGGRVALLRVIEPEEGAEWGAVAEMMREEKREDAERILQGAAAEVNRITGAIPLLLIREGNPRDALLALLEEDPRISILVLATSTDSSGPGPLITALAGRYASRMRVPMTIVPGGMEEAELDRVT